jgi:hypothetical protein
MRLCMQLLTKVHVLLEAFWGKCFDTMLDRESLLYIVDIHTIIGRALSFQGKYM